MAKYTEQELRNMLCDKFMPFETVGWTNKIFLYRETESYDLYKELKKSYKDLLVDCDGLRAVALADQITQFLVDTYLIRKSRGELVKRPVPYNRGVVEKKHDMMDDLFERSDFSDEAFEATSDPVKEIIWIYNHLLIKGVDKKSAPTPGAYNYLVWAQSSLVNRTDFLKTIYPKIIPSKAQIEKGSGANDDGRPNLNLIEKLLRQISRHKKEASIL